MAEKGIVLFDGVCNLCNGFVDAIIRRDPEGRISFAALQKGKGKELAGQRGIERGMQTVVLIQGDKHYTRSDAILRILRVLGLPWSLTYALILLPRFLRDPIYNYVASHRYGWFGKRDTCRMPTDAEKKRFL